MPPPSYVGGATAGEIGMLGAGNPATGQVLPGRSFGSFFQLTVPLGPLASPLVAITPIRHSNNVDRRIGLFEIMQ